MCAICYSTSFTFSFVLGGGLSCGLSQIFLVWSLVWFDALKHGVVSELISLNFNKLVCVVRHCHGEDHKTCQEFTLVWLIIMNAATLKL